MEIQKPNLFLQRLRKNYTRGKRAIFRLRRKITRHSRPSSYPYVSGDSFRALADHIHDETGSFDPAKVRTGDIVFCSNPLMLSYMREVHPKISETYILIEHNGDLDMGQEVLDLVDNKIFKLYGQYFLLSHPKLIHLPIALENLHYYMNGIPSMFDRLRERMAIRPPHKLNRIFYQFSVGTNPGERGPAKEYFSRHSLMDTTNMHLDTYFHLQILMNYKFVASPPGNGIESSRTWEALLLKTVPIVKDFPSNRYYASLGLPIWVVKDWEELEEFDEGRLAEKYDALISRANWKPLFMDFWIDMIRRDQAKLKSER